MFSVNVVRVLGKMGEKQITRRKLSEELHIGRNTLNSYLNNPGKIPYDVLSDMANILCDTATEAREIFFSQ